jgi:hypothetical protein
MYRPKIIPSLHWGLSSRRSYCFFAIQVLLVKINCSADVAWCDGQAFWYSTTASSKGLANQMALLLSQPPFSGGRQHLLPACGDGKIQTIHDAKTGDAFATSLSRHKPQTDAAAEVISHQEK